MNYFRSFGNESNCLYPDDWRSLFWLHRSNGVERCYCSGACVRACLLPSVRPSRNVPLCSANKRLNLEAPILYTFACRPGKLVSWFSSKSSTLLIFIQGQRFESSTLGTLLFRKTVTVRASIAIANNYKIAFGLSTGIFTIDWHILKFKVNIMPISTVNISQTLLGKTLLLATNRTSHVSFN